MIPPPSPKTLDRFRSIVAIPPQFADSAEEKACQDVIGHLSDSELEETARISYAYWALQMHQSSNTSSDVCQSEEYRRPCALKIAKWHVESVGGHKHVDKAVQHLKDALEIRRKYKMELMRTCFSKSASLSKEEASLRDDIAADMDKQLQVLYGQDRQGHPLIVKLPRRKPGATESSYIHQQLYVAERSAAVTEYVSRGKLDTVTAIFNLKNQPKGNAPALTWQYNVIGMVQQVAPGRIGRVLVLDPPFLIRQVFNLIKPLLSQSLKESTDLCSGSTKDQLLRETLEHPDIFTKDGGLIESIDIDKYFYETPFYYSYGY